MTTSDFDALTGRLRRWDSRRRQEELLLWLPRGEWLTVPWLDADVRIVSALAAATETGDRLPNPL